MNCAEAYAHLPHQEPNYRREIGHDFEGQALHAYGIFLQKPVGETYQLLSVLDDNTKPVVHTFVHLLRDMQVTGSKETAHMALLEREMRLMLSLKKTADNDEEEGEEDEEEEDEDDSDADETASHRSKRQKKSKTASRGVAGTKMYTNGFLDTYMDQVGEVIVNVNESSPSAFGAVLYLINVDVEAEGVSRPHRLGQLLLAFTQGRDDVPLGLPALGLFSDEINFFSKKADALYKTTMMMPFKPQPRRVFNRGQWGDVKNNLHPSIQSLSLAGLRYVFIEAYPCTRRTLTNGFKLFGDTQALFSMDTVQLVIMDELEKLNHATGEHWDLSGNILPLLRLSGDTFKIPVTLPLRDCKLINPIPPRIDRVLDVKASIYLHYHVYTGQGSVRHINTYYAQCVEEDCTIGVYNQHYYDTLENPALDTTAEDMEMDADTRAALRMNTVVVPIEYSNTVVRMEPSVAMSAGVPSFDGMHVINPQDVLSERKTNGLIRYTSAPLLQHPQDGDLYSSRLSNRLASRFFHQHADYVISHTIEETERRINLSISDRALFSSAHRAVLNRAKPLLEGNVVSAGLRIRSAAHEPMLPLCDYMQSLWLILGNVFYAAPNNRASTVHVLMAACSPRSQFHHLYQAPAGTGKSFKMDNARDILIPGTYLMVTTQSLASVFGAGVVYIDAHRGIWFFDEMGGVFPISSTNPSGVPDVKQNENANLIKTVLDFAAASKELIRMSRETGGRSIERFDLAADVTVFALTNLTLLSDGRVDCGVTDRSIVEVSAGNNREVGIACEGYDEDEEVDDGAPGPSTLVPPHPTPTTRAARSRGTLHHAVHNKQGRTNSGGYWNRIKSQRAPTEPSYIEGLSPTATFSLARCHKYDVQKTAAFVQMLCCIADEMLEMLEIRMEVDARVVDLMPSMEIYDAVENIFTVALQDGGIPNGTNRLDKMTRKQAQGMAIKNEILWCLYNTEEGIPITLSHIMLLVARAVVTEDIALFALATTYTTPISQFRVLCMMIARFVDLHHESPREIYNQRASDTGSSPGGSVSGQYQLRSVPAVTEAWAAGIAGQQPPAIRSIGSAERDFHLKVAQLRHQTTVLHQEPDIEQMRAGIGLFGGKLQEIVQLVSGVQEEQAEGEKEREESRARRADALDAVQHEYDRRRIYIRSYKSHGAFRSAIGRLLNEVGHEMHGYYMSYEELKSVFHQYGKVYATDVQSVSEITRHGRVIRISAADVDKISPETPKSTIIQTGDMREDKTSVHVSCILAHNGNIYAEQCVAHENDPGLRVGMGFFSVFNALYLSHKAAVTRKVVLLVPSNNGTSPGQFPGTIVIKRNRSVEIPAALKPLYHKYNAPCQGVYRKIPLERKLLEKKFERVRAAFGDSFEELPFILAGVSDGKKVSKKSTCSYDLFPMCQEAGFTKDAFYNKFDL